MKLWWYTGEQMAQFLSVTIEGECSETSLEPQRSLSTRCHHTPLLQQRDEENCPLSHLDLSNSGFDYSANCRGVDYILCPLFFFTFPASFCNILRNFRIYPSILPLWPFRDQHRVECIIWYWNTVAEWMGDTMQWIAGHASNNVGSCWIQPAIHNGNWNLVHPWSRPQLKSML